MAIRSGWPGDAFGLARVHVDAWRAAYAGLIADKVLQNLSYEKGAEQWQKVLSGPGAAHVHVAEDETGSIVGFAFGGEAREAPAPYTGELYAIYILPAFQRRGLGRALVHETARTLLKAGIDSMITWTLAADPAKGFYEALGGTVVDRKWMQVAGGEHEVVEYGWPDLRELSVDPGGNRRRARAGRHPPPA